jgi:hypothetical protein
MMITYTLLLSLCGRGMGIPGPDAPRQGGWSVIPAKAGIQGRCVWGSPRLTPAPGNR